MPAGFLMPPETSVRRRVRVAVAASLIASCAATVGVRTQSAPVKMDGYPDPGSPALVVLTTAGAEPRAKLRYAVPKTYKDHMLSTISMSMAMDMAGAPMPPMDMPAMVQGTDLAITDVQPSGDIAYSVSVSSFGVDAKPGDPPAMAAMAQTLGPYLQAASDTIKSVKGMVTMSDRGIAKSIAFDTSKVTDPQLKQLMDTAAVATQSLSTVLPEEAVGVGARWETRQALASGGIQIFQKSTFEVTAIDGKTISLKVTMEQTAPSQAIDAPGMPAGAQARVQKYSGSGSGTLSIRLDSLVPTSTLTMQNTLVTEIAMGGDAQTVTNTTSLKVIIAPGK